MKERKKNKEVKYKPPRYHSANNQHFEMWRVQDKDAVHRFSLHCSDEVDELRYQ